MATSILVKRARGNFRLLQHSRLTEIVIEEDSDTSEMIYIEGYKNMAIEFPESMDGTELTFEATTEPEEDSPSWKSVYDDKGNEISVNVQEDAFVVLAHLTDKVNNSNNFVGPLHWIRLKSNSTETSERTLKVLMSR